MTINEKTFVEHGRRYSVFLNESNKTSENNCSCIIIEDEPGAYYPFIEQLVEDGICRLAATLPFSDQSLCLLNGDKVSFNEDVTIQIPTLTRCVVILDMRNESKSTFNGETDKTMAGAHFQRQLNSQIVSFFATGYGSMRFKDSGLNGIYGFVDVSRKSGIEHADLSDKDKSILLAAVKLGLNDLCFRTQNSIIIRKKLVVFSFRGWEMPFVLNKPMQLIIEIIKAGHKGKDHNELTRLISGKAYQPEHDALDNFDTAELGIDGTMKSSKGKKVEDIYTREDLQSFKQIVEQYDHWLSEIANLKRTVAQAIAEEPSFNQMCKMVIDSKQKDPEDQIDLETLYEILIAKYSSKHETKTEEEINRLTQLVILGIKNQIQLKNLQKSEFSAVSENDLKHYRNLLYKWGRQGYSRELIIYKEPSYTQTVRRYVNRGLTAIKKEDIPQEFYRHLRDSIQVDSERAFYTGEEEWSFK